MVAVEHHGERRLQTGVQRLEIAPREDRQPGMVFRTQNRQRLGVVWPDVFRRQSQIVEKRRDFAIAFVELVPEAGDCGVIEIARRQGGLAAARRPGNPNHRSFAPLVEQPEQALARQDPRQARPGGLSK